jgi:hypothetical protein
VKKIIALLAVVVALTLCYWYYHQSQEAAEAERDRRSDLKQLKHDALQAAYDRNYTQACILYKQLVEQRVQLSESETQTLEAGCARSKGL